MLKDRKRQPYPPQQDLEFKKKLFFPVNLPNIILKFDRDNI